MAFNFFFTEAKSLRKEFKKELKEIKKGIKDSVNKTAKEFKTEYSVILRKRYNIKAKALRKAYKIKLRAALNRPFAKVRISGKSIPLIDLKGRKKQTKVGVSFAVTKGKTKTLPGTFLTKVGNGHKGIFKKGKKKKLRRLKVGRRKLYVLKKGKNVGEKTYGYLPIDEVFTAPISYFFNSTSMQPQMDASVEKILEEILKKVL